MHHGRTIVPLYGVKVRIEVQGTPLEAVVDTGAEVTLLSADVYNQIQLKPPVRR